MTVVRFGRHGHGAPPLVPLHRHEAGTSGVREQTQYHVFADNLLVGSFAAFVEAGVTAREAALQRPGVLFTVARTTGGTHAVQVARFRVVDGALEAWVS